MTRRNLPLFVAAAALAVGCQSVYYRTMETIGIPKRDILADRVEDARNSQQRAGEQFSSALEQFRAVVDFDGGDLEKTYNKLRRELERSEDRAADVTDRIDAVDNVSRALFREWEGELKDYNDPAMRRASQDQLQATRDECDRVVGAMRRAESRMEPVLQVFRDQVLFLKHNLNARAIASLRGELPGIESSVNELVAEMETAIREADDFLAGLEKD